MDLTQQEALRASKQLRPLLVEDEGVPLSLLPDNVFGFTFSTLNESTPLFIRRAFQSFEVHKLMDGEIHLLGYLTAEQAGTVQSGGEAVECNLYPEPREKSDQLVEIPVHRISKARQLSRTDGNYMPIRVEAAH
ncbi:MAG: hypothetical protein JJE04_03925 [Acidobacteriia bacterium]|nr:hypothetical protein [Terriglobia bacterium]